MKPFFSKIASVSLAFLVLFSTFSFTVEKHYCGDFLVDVSYLGETEGCGMEMDSIDAVKKKNCCKDEVENIEGQDELQQSSNIKLDFKNQQFLTAFLVSYQDVFIKKESKKIGDTTFSPPDKLLDYQVLYQTFLI